MNLSDDTLRRFYRAKEFVEEEGVRHIKYSPSGKSLCVSLGGRLKVYDSLNGKLRNIINVDAPIFTHTLENLILHSSSDKNIKLLSLYDSKHISTFKSHPDKVSFISASQNNDTFLSSSKSGVRMWDLRCRNPIYKLDAQNGLSAFIGDGFIVGFNSLLAFYDTRCATGPYKIMSPPYCEYKRIVSTNKHFCMSGSSNHHVFSFGGDLVQSIKTEKVSFMTLTPESKHSICSSSSFLFCTNIDSKTRIHTLKDDDPRSFGMIDFNPSYGQFATSSPHLRFWMPQVG